MGTEVKRDKKGGLQITYTHEDNDDNQRRIQWMLQLSKRYGVPINELDFISDQDWRKGGYLSLEELNERERDGRDGVPIKGTIHLVRKPH